MKIVKTNKNFENKLLKRKEIELIVSSKIVPSLLETKKFLSENFSTSPESIKIISLLGSFGSNNFKITANIYSSKKDMEDIEKIFKKEKKSELNENKETNEDKE